MKMTIFIASVLLLMLSALPAVAQTETVQPLQAVIGTEAPQAGAAWEAFARTVQTGKRIAVTLADSADVTGRLLSVDPHSLRIEAPSGTQVLEPARIVQIRYAGLRKRNTLYGMLAGLAAGAVTTVIIDQSSSHPSTVAEAAGVGGFLVGLPLGAVVGALIPVGPPLYEAPVSQSR